LEILDDLKISKLLAIFAHPDDAEAACGGTLSKYSNMGVEVGLLCVAQGDKGRGELSDREAELQQASNVLGVSSVDTLGFKDGEFDNDLDLRKVLTEKIRSFKPDLVICPDPTAVFFSHAYVNHRDHRQTGWAVLDVVSSATSNKKYFSNSPAHEVSHLLCAGTLEPNCVVEITEQIDKKIEAVLCYKSQISGDYQKFSDSLLDAAKRIGSQVGLEFGEAYRYSSLSRSDEQV